MPRCVIYSWATSRDPLRLAVRSFHELRFRVTPSRWSLTTSNWAVKNFIMAVLEASLIRNCSLVKHEWHVFAISLAVTWVLVLMRRAQSFAGWGEQPRWLQGNTFPPHTPPPTIVCLRLNIFLECMLLLHHSLTGIIINKCIFKLRIMCIFFCNHQQLDTRPPQDGHFGPV